jgi:hypothetical protein
MFCDAAHATCLSTRRSTTGIIIFINGSPISWYSKRQNTIETSTFGSEFVALKIALEMMEQTTEFYGWTYISLPFLVTPLSD